MLNKIKINIIAAGLGFSFISGASVCFADNSACATYLAMPDNTFTAMISQNSATAGAVAQTLKNCSDSNACAQINSDHCAVVLANRLFASDYFAASGHSGDSALPPTTATTTTAQPSIPAHTDTIISTKVPPSHTDHASINWL